MATSVNIRMYRIGELGDCFLLTFNTDGTLRHMLIDCGSFRNSKESKDRLVTIVRDIKAKVQKDKGKLDIVVGTHQHNDHVSGFVHAQKDFAAIGIRQVWLSWLDNPRNKVAASIGQNHIGLRKALKQSLQVMDGLAKKRGNKTAAGLSTGKIRGVQSLVSGMLDFFGAAPELPAEGIKILKKAGENAVDYLQPGDVRLIDGISKQEVKIHVLGPPVDKTLLYRKDPKSGESYDHKLRSAHTMAQHFVEALGNHKSGDSKREEHFPFNGTYKRFRSAQHQFDADLKDVFAEYTAQRNAWRNADNDWLEQAGRLALYLDTFTNNSSLVLAIELVKSEKVLLFAADAQTGNWISWNDIKFADKKTTINGLLERTVFYKVGHHGSHNSTLKPAFEKMNSDELVAMIPVDKTDPNITKKDGWKMPAAKLFQRIKEKTNSRVLRMDEGYARGCDPASNPAWKKVGKVTIDDLFIDFTIS